MAVLLVCLLHRSSSLITPRRARSTPSTPALSVVYASTAQTAPQPVTPDGEVTKEILTKGQGKKVETGDILAVEYSAAVLLPSGGKKTFARGDKEKFIFKDGSMIKGWDAAVGSMKVGEKARFLVGPRYGYGAKGVGADVIPADASLEFEIRLQAWLGNQLRPETLFQKDLDVDPFIASTPEAIQAEFEAKQDRKNEKYAGNIVDIYLRRLKNISFGFGGSGFFVSQSGERPPWYLNPNITFPSMIMFVIVAFATVLSSGAIKEKGGVSDIDISSIQSIDRGSLSLRVSHSLSHSPYDTLA